MFGFFDPVYLLFVAPAMLLALFAQVRVKRAMVKYSRVAAGAGVTGARAAREILDRSGLDHVRVERVAGFLSDHYDPRSRVLRLSPDVHDGYSVAALGVAAHEAGHALQHSHGYKPLILRQTLAPAAMFGSNFAWILLLVGFFAQSMGLVKIGILLFSAGVLFTLVTLPVEFDASRRAKQILPQLGLVTTRGEAQGVGAVLNAAAMTYVAAAVAAIAQLLYFLLRAGLLGGREE
jgi:hypothetical protein